MQWRFSSCLTYRGSRLSIRSRSGTGRLEVSTRRVDKFELVESEPELTCGWFVAKTAIPFLVGTKYDHFNTFAPDEQEEITRQVSYSFISSCLWTPLNLVSWDQARRFAKAMKAPLIFCSTSHSINVQKIFKIVLSKVSCRSLKLLSLEREA